MGSRFESRLRVLRQSSASSEGKRPEHFQIGSHGNRFSRSLVDDGAAVNNVDEASGQSRASQPSGEPDCDNGGFTSPAGISRRRGCHR